MANVEFYQDESEKAEWRWRVTASDGTLIGKSTEGYSRKHNAENNLRSLPNYTRSVDIKTAAAVGTTRPPGARLPLEFYTDDGGKWRWRVTAGNGNIVYASPAGFDTKETAVLNLEGLLYATAAWNKKS
jgi:uncharacterized protein YegP (UPF0339 family)